MHLGSILDGLELGMEVEEGMQIGTIGRSGDGRIDRHTAHLHYELKIDGVNIDPTLGPDHLNDPMVYIRGAYEKIPPSTISESAKVMPVILSHAVTNQKQNNK